MPCSISNPHQLHAIQMHFINPCTISFSPWDCVYFVDAVIALISNMPEGAGGGVGGSLSIQVKHY